MVIINGFAVCLAHSNLFLPLVRYADRDSAGRSKHEAKGWRDSASCSVLTCPHHETHQSFDHIPERQLWILPSVVPDVIVDKASVMGPSGEVPLPFTFAASKAPAMSVSAVWFER